MRRPLPRAACETPSGWSPCARPYFIVIEWLMYDDDQHVGVRHLGEGLLGFEAEGSAGGHELCGCSDDDGLQ